MTSVLVDVTAAPYHCDPTGARDCTAALRQALDDALADDRALQLAAIARMAAPGAQAEGPETRPQGVHFHRDAPPARILYLPAGVYRVSGTIGYGWGDHVNSRNGDHLARGIHWQGAGPGRTVIRLDDRCPAFATPDGRAVIEVLRGLKSAVCMQNTIEGLTVDTGCGNPGAVGIDFYCNNTGAVREVEVRSGDGAGLAGIAIRKWNSSCALIQRVRVSGFRHGLQFLHHRLYSVVEDAELTGQAEAGVFCRDHNLALHRIVVSGAAPALVVAGTAAHVVALGLTARDPGPRPAVEVRDGACLVRDLSCPQRAVAIAHREGGDEPGPAVAEWSSHAPIRLFPDQPAATLRLPVEDPPAVPLADADWVEVAAPGDGLTDAGPAIAAACASGARGLRFGRGRFRLDAPIRIPAQVERLDFAFADLEAGPALHQRRDRGVLLVGDGPRPLLIERLFTMTGFHGPFRLIEHDGVRDLVLRDLHTQYCALYANTIPGSRVFIDNCACTCEGHEDLPGFRFRGQRVWARQLNPERAHEQVVNDGGDLWVLGFKTENPSTAFLTRGGGRSEILGGIFNQVRQYHAGGATRPTVLNEDSSVSVSASTTDWKANRSFEGPAHVLVREICGGQRRDLVWEVLPLRQQHLVTLPLYAGRS